MSTAVGDTDYVIDLYSSVATVFDIANPSVLAEGSQSALIPITRQGEVSD